VPFLTYNLSPLENLARCLPTYIHYSVFNEHRRLCRRSQRPFPSDTLWGVRWHGTGGCKLLQKDVLPDLWIETPDCASTDLEDWQKVGLSADSP